MKSLEADLMQAGLDDHQLNLLRQQHTHLRGEGRSAELGSLALRSRFLNLDDLIDSGSQEDSNVIGDHFTLQTILPLEFCRRFVCVPTEFPTKSKALGATWSTTLTVNVRVAVVVPSLTLTVNVSEAPTVKALMLDALGTYK